MPTVVIIHAAQDALPAQALADKLRAANLTPVLEKSGDELRTAIKGAAVTLALWSPNAIAQPALSEDAQFARSKSKLIHVTMQSARAPEQFRQDSPINLTGWRGEEDFPAWLHLVKQVAAKAGVTPPPPPPPRPPSGFFQPGRVDPNAPATPLPRAAAPQGRAQQQPQRAQAAPRAAAAASSNASSEPKSGGGGRGMLIGIIALVVIAAGGGGGYYFWSQSQGGGAAEAWAEIDPNDAAALRAFISDNPGDLRGQAEAALTTLDARSYEAARAEDTVEALEAYLQSFPQSEHALVVRGRIAELRGAPAAPAPVVPEAAPAPAPAPEPEPAPPASAEPAPTPLTPPPEPAEPSNGEPGE